MLEVVPMRLGGVSPPRLQAIGVIGFVRRRAKSAVDAAAGSVGFATGQSAIDPVDSIDSFGCRSVVSTRGRGYWIPMPGHVAGN